MNATASKRVERLTELHNTIKEKCKLQSLRQDDVSHFAEIIHNTPKDADEMEREKIAEILKAMALTVGQNKAVIEKAANAVAYTRLEEALNAGLQHFTSEQTQTARKVNRPDASRGV